MRGLPPKRDECWFLISSLEGGPARISKLYARRMTVDVLRRMLGMFRSEFSYRGREAEGTQPPSETLRTRSGTCREPLTRS